MKTQKWMISVVSATLLSTLVACTTAPSSYVVLLPNADGSVGKVTVQGTAGNQLLTQAQHGALLNGSQAPAPISNSVLERDFGATMKARPALPETFVLYFETGSSILTAESQALLPRIVERTLARKTVDISVVGHTDTQGSVIVNESVAMQRANSITRQLRAMGLNHVPILTESHGKRNLLVPTPDGIPEPRNRRVEVSVR